MRFRRSRYYGGYRPVRFAMSPEAREYLVRKKMDEYRDELDTATWNFLKDVKHLKEYGEKLMTLADFTIKWKGLVDGGGDDYSGKYNLAKYDEFIKLCQTVGIDIKDCIAGCKNVAKVCKKFNDIDKIR